MTRNTIVALLILAGLSASLIAADTLPENWQSLDVAGLAALAKTQAEAGDAGQANRVALAGHIKTAYLSNATVTKTVALTDWQAMTASLRADLSAEDKTLWVTRLREAFAADANAVSAINGPKLPYLSDALWRLGDAQWMELTVTWVSRGGDLASLPSERIVDMLWAFCRGTGDACQSARALVVGHIKTKYLASVTATRTVSINTWSSMSLATGKALSAEDRTLWATRLREAFASDATTIGKLKYQELDSVLTALRSLGDDQWPVVVATWVSGADLTSLSADEVVGLLSRLDSAGEVGKAAQARMAGHIKTSYLSNSTAVRAIKMEQWGSMAEVLCGELSAEDRSLWITRLREAFAADANAIQTLDGQEVALLSKLLRRLGDSEQVDQLIATWLKADHTSLSQSSRVYLADLLVTVASSGDANSATMMADVERALLAGGTPSDWELWRYGRVVEAWLSIKDRTKAQQWAMRAYQRILGTEAARAAASLEDLRSISSLLYRSGLLEADTNHALYTATVIALAKRDGLKELAPTESLETLVRPLCATRALQAVRNELLDAEGAPRRDVATLLAWVYRRAGEMKAWQTYLDQQIASAQGDKKALWLLARARTVSLIEKDVSLHRGSHSIVKALAAAQSQQTRMVVVRELSTYYETIKRYDVGVSVLDSIKNQFTGEPLAELTALRTSLKDALAEQQAAAATARAARQATQKKWQLVYFRKQLAIAQAKGQQDKVAKLQAAIAELEG